MQRLIVGVSGASGAPLAVSLLRQLQEIPEVESHLILTRGAAMTLRQETDLSVDEVCSLADAVYDNENIGAAPASGTFDTMGMAVVPCSMKTVAGICFGYSDSLLLRSADVTIKEQRKLVLAVRESPLSPIHLRNLSELAGMGVLIVPPVVSYYERDDSLTAFTDRFAARILARFGLKERELFHWQGMDA